MLQERELGSSGCLPLTCCLAAGLGSSFPPSLAGATPPAPPRLSSAPEPSVPALLLPVAQGSGFRTRRDESEGQSFPILSSPPGGTERVTENKTVGGTPYLRHGYSTSHLSSPDISVMTQEQFWLHGRKGHEARDGGNRPGSHLVTKHQGDDLQHVEAPLLLCRRAGQEEEQVVQATEVQRPEKPVVDAGVIVDPLSGERTGGKGGTRSVLPPCLGVLQLTP